MKITANHITLTRIVFLPAPLFLFVYGGEASWWTAFFLMTFLGMTDFVDGILARRDGPTRFGGLIDPVADKIFIACVLLAMPATGRFPLVFCMSILLRELLITGLRSSMGIRKASIKTSTLAKMKTIIQMGGFGTIFLTLFLGKVPLMVACLALCLPFLATDLAYRIRGKTPPYWAFWVFAAFVFVGLNRYFWGKEICMNLQFVVIGVLTWASAIDYLLGSFKVFKKTGLKFYDINRAVFSGVCVFCLMPLLSINAHAAIPIFFTMSLAFMLLGIDGVLASEGKEVRSSAFYLSSGAMISLYVVAKFSGSIEAAYGVAIIGALFLGIVCSATFRKWRALIMKEI